MKTRGTGGVAGRGDGWMTLNLDRPISGGDQRLKMHRRTTDGGSGVPFALVIIRATSQGDRRWMGGSGSDGVRSYRVGSNAER